MLGVLALAGGVDILTPAPEEATATPAGQLALRPVGVDTLSPTETDVVGVLVLGVDAGTANLCDDVATTADPLAPGATVLGPEFGVLLLGPDAVTLVLGPVVGVLLLSKEGVTEYPGRDPEVLDDTDVTKELVLLVAVVGAEALGAPGGRNAGKRTRLSTEGLLRLEAADELAGLEVDGVAVYITQLHCQWQRQCYTPSSDLFIHFS